MIQRRHLVNQADHTAVRRKNNWFSVEHFLEWFVFHPEPFIIAWLLTGSCLLERWGERNGGLVNT